MTDARTGSGRRPVGGDVYPGGTAMPPGREQGTTDWGDASVSGVTPGQEEPRRMDDRDDLDDRDDRGAPGQAVLVAGDGPGHERDAGDGPGPETDAGRGGGQLMPREECGQLERRLQHAVTGFVDEPRAAVEEADRAVEEITARFTDAIDRRRRTLRGSWQSAEANRPGSADTEQLRLALRDYRELADRLLHM
ncbi:MAG: hypothetical protein JF597_22830 [Streptomyces sp.]|uniref:hypothetical protein n=1 Tax=Streptomyces sp. TaxID=1931 RepID=UPI0025DECB5C|nr:hypothetical protein [Streptomyces sp.]MBW8796326.1 hypothetical protein [Streptomyces sp.]